VDLAASFGDRFRVSLEAGAETRHKWAEPDRVWLVEIRGRFGTVHPYGGELLCAISKTGHTGAKLRRLPFVLAAKGDQETVIRFHVDHAEDVFEIIKPYRCRRVSEEQRQRLAAMGTAALSKHRALSNVQSVATAVESTQSGPCEQMGVGA